jgi:hypothetical protein
MRLILRALALAGVAAVIVAGAVSVYASNNATWNLSFSVATVTGLVNNTADVNLGPLVPGAASAPQSDTLTITSNDVAGVQLQASTTSVAAVPESGTSPCVPQANRTSSGTTLALTVTTTTGGSGGNGGVLTGGSIVSATHTLTGTLQNLFFQGPTNVGTLTEIGSLVLTPGTATAPNTSGCSYTYPVNYVLIAQ